MKQTHPMTQESDHREIERLRLAALLGANIEVADALRAPEFVLVHPSGGTWDKAFYLGSVASGHIVYRRFEVSSL